MPPRTSAPRTTLPAALAVVLVSLLAAGCAASGSPAYDGRFGDATRALRAQQIIDERAPTRNAGIRPATDGRTMREAIDRHLGSFKEPPPTNVISIGFGAGGNGN